MTLMIAEAVLSDRARQFLEYMKWDFREGRGSSTEIGRQIAYVLAAFLVFLLVLYWLSVAQRRRTNPIARQPQKLFRAVLRDLGLSFSDRLLLQSVARTSGFKQPTAMLLSPELLERASRQWHDGVLLKSVRSAAWRRLSAACRQIHGQPFGDN